MYATAPIFVAISFPCDALGMGNTMVMRIDEVGLSSRASVPLLRESKSEKETAVDPS
jgi:hypothetical protein